MNSLFTILFVVMVLGYCYFRANPAKISHVIGFRTPSAYKSTENWQRAQKIGYGISLPTLAILTVLNYLLVIPTWMSISLLVIWIAITVSYIEWTLNK